MKTSEAIKALQKGKKMKKSYWPKDEFIYCDPKTNKIFDENGIALNVAFAWFLDDQWEEVEE